MEEAHALRLSSLADTLANLTHAAQEGELTRIYLPEAPTVRLTVDDGLARLEEQIGDLAQALGRGPVPLALNQAKTALAGASALLLFKARPIESPLDGVTQQIRLAAAFLCRAQLAGSAVGSG